MLKKPSNTHLFLLSVRAHKHPAKLQLTCRAQRASSLYTKKKKTLCACCLCACVYFFLSWAAAEGLFVRRGHLLSVWAKKWKNPSHRGHLYASTHYLPTLKGSTDCDSSERRTRVFAYSAERTDRQVYPLCCAFNWKQLYKGGKVGGLRVIVPALLSGAHLVSAFSAHHEINL